MRALRKGQASIFNLTQDIRGEARIVERAFGIAPVRSQRQSLSSVKGPTSNLLNLKGYGNVPDSLRPNQKFATEPYFLQSRELTKMEGEQFTLRCQKNSQDSVRISDATLIPLRLKRVEARYDGVVWEHMLATASPEIRAMLVFGVEEISPVNDAIKQAIARREKVDGATVTRGYHIRVA